MTPILCSAIPDTVPAIPASRPNSVIVWLLQGARLGDNQQVLALGAALEARFGWKLVVKQLKFERGPVPGSDPKDGIRHLKRAESDCVFATEDDPWPHVVIAIGRRAAPVARWVAAQGAPYAIHIQLGRFQDPYETVDLLVTTAQYGLPGGPNVLHLSLPITARKVAILARAAEAFKPLFAEHKGPQIGVLIGGPSNPMKFSDKDGKRLLQEALAFADKRQGRLLVATSPRTPAEVVAHFEAHLPAPHRLFPFRPGAGDANPYPALLAGCDAFIVTNDSVSMVADAALTGREVRLFELPVVKPRPMWEPSWPIAHWVGRRRNQRLVKGKSADWLDRWFEAKVRAAHAQPVRYVPIIMARLLREGHVATLANPQSPRTDLAQLAVQELDMVAARIVALLAEKRAKALRSALAEGGGPAANALPVRAMLPTFSELTPAAG
ncbi:ELM1/GtrOC1 family putative glycosyltransferase [Dongia sp.]|uniref:ELM1/GtrOC1 family putative glycosyltransferase n=1 Tax=Dongia sp. TaxID=1977262 RepID=UPI0035B351E7